MGYGSPDGTMEHPLIPPSNIAFVAKNLQEHQSAGIATLCTPIEGAEEFFDPHAVKVVCDKEGYALYFSRAPIPWDRDEFATGSERN